MITSEHITGLILAGGRAQRMGGIDKGLIPFHGKPLIESAISRLKPQVSTILINANRSITKYAHYGYPVLMDETPDFSGPLAGFSVGLKHCKTPYLHHPATPLYCQMILPKKWQPNWRVIILSLSLHPREKMTERYGRNLFSV